MDINEVLEALCDQLGERHVMLSYQWDLQDLVSGVYDVIKGYDLNVWMDIEGGVSGNINEAMAQGIEGGAIICPFMTQKYEKSKNCSAELNYANDRGVVIVPCMAQSRTDEGNCYRASGWLGIITAGKLWIDFKSDDQLERRVIQLLNECCTRLYVSEKPVGKMMFMKKKAEKKKPRARKKKILAVTAPLNTAMDVITVPEVAKISFPLHQPLEVGDVIEIWGDYDYGRFTCNILDKSEMELLLHFDVRSAEKAIVMNSKNHGAWQSEVRDWDVVRKFENGEFSQSFHLKIICGADRFMFEMNGVPLTTEFPYRVALRLSEQIVLANQGPGRRWSMLKIPTKIVTSIIPQGKDCQDIKENKEIILEEALKIGDCVEAWGVYKATGRFNLNIMRPKADYLLHMDVRPESSSIVLDSTLDSAWPGTLNIHNNDAFAKLTSGENDEFHVKINCTENGLTIEINGHDLGICAPYIFDLSTATYILCEGNKASSVQRWKKIKMPKPCQILQTFSPYELESLGVGDIINITGIYHPSHENFSFNIFQDQANLLLHISIRPSYGQIVLNAIIANGWGQEIHAAIPPEMNACDVFDVFITVQERDYKLEFSKDEDNENVFLEMSFPHRGRVDLAKYVEFHDKSDDVWTELYLPDGSSFCRSLE